MAKLDITLSKEKFDALAEPLKEFYTVNKDGQYELEGIGSIQRGLAAEKAGKDAAIADAVAKATAEALKPFEGIDAEAAKAAIENAAKVEEDKKKKSGDFDGLKLQLEERHAAERAKDAEKLKAVADEKDSILATLKRAQLANVLTEKGVLPDRAKYLVGELEADMELVPDEANPHGFSLKKIGGIGDATEFDLIIEGVKEKSPFFFASSSASGSGASGSSTNGKTGLKEIPRSEYDANPEKYAAQFAKGEATLAEK